MSKLKDEIQITGSDSFTASLVTPWGKYFHPRHLSGWVHQFVTANAERGLSAVYRETGIYFDCNRMSIKYEIMNHGKWLDEPRFEVSPPEDWTAPPDLDTPDEQEWQKMKRD